MRAADHEVLRRQMLAEISAATVQVSGLIGKAALNERVMAAMGKVARHEFVPVELQPYAYANLPHPFGFNKTISQPFIVALMDRLISAPMTLSSRSALVSAIRLRSSRSWPGRCTATSLFEELGQQAKQRLRREGCTNVELKIANGYHGWSEHAPFDRVIVTAAPHLIPPPLIRQLKNGGKMVIPAGLPDAQQLVLVDKDGNGRVTMREILQVRFSQLEDTEPD